MRETYDACLAVAKIEMAARLRGELAWLLDLPLPVWDRSAGSFDELLDTLEPELDRVIDTSERHAPAATRALAAALTYDRERPLRGLAEDLAEILFLPREQRSEYTANRHVSPPYKVRKLLLEYAVLSRRLDELVGVISKGYCATRCEKLPVGCCHILGYDLGLVPEAMLELQRLEALRNGWREPPHEEHCRYHSVRGCVIALFKSPACVGYLCEHLTAHLRSVRGGPALSRFLKALARFNNCDLDRKRVFDAMGETIEAGVALVGTQALKGLSLQRRGTTGPQRGSGGHPRPAR